MATLGSDLKLISENEALEGRDQVSTPLLRYHGDVPICAKICNVRCFNPILVGALAS